MHGTTYGDPWTAIFQTGFFIACTLRRVRLHRIEHPGGLTSTGWTAAEPLAGPTRSSQVLLAKHCNAPLLPAIIFIADCDALYFNCELTVEMFVAIRKSRH
jgi:hypothetical protein